VVVVEFGERTRLVDATIEAQLRNIILDLARYQAL
jgi:hypothetical protein